jgi:hypothetical protein
VKKGYASNVERKDTMPPSIKREESLRRINDMLIPLDEMAIIILGWKLTWLIERIKGKAMPRNNIISSKT